MIYLDFIFMFQYKNFSMLIACQSYFEPEVDYTK